jgi:hypothetical protein
MAGRKFKKILGSSSLLVQDIALSLLFIVLLPTFYQIQ